MLGSYKIMIHIGRIRITAESPALEGRGFNARISGFLPLEGVTGFTLLWVTL